MSNEFPDAGMVPSGETRSPVCVPLKRPVMYTSSPASTARTSSMWASGKASLKTRANASCSEAFSPLVVNKPGGVYLDNFVLKCTVSTPKPVLPEHPLADPDPSAAQAGSRRAWWPQQKDWVETPIYAAELLEPGHALEGPAIVEAPLTTVVVPPGFRYAIDRYGLGILEPATAATAGIRAATEGGTQP
jgi:N-methylhydantoinase A/oxoprolinase/acetone carboxylase beta subunit